VNTFTSQQLGTGKWTPSTHRTGEFVGSRADTNVVDLFSYISGLHYDAANNSDYTALNDLMTEKNELERMRKKAAMVLFKV
jgi:hypothetical protein